MLTMYQQITIKTLEKQGTSIAQIAKELGCHRNTIRNVLKRDKIREKQTREKASQFEPHKTKIEEWLDKDTSRLRILELINEQNNTEYSYESLCKYTQKQFPKKPKAYGVQEHNPGEEAEIDFGELGKFYKAEGQLVKTYGIVIVLPYSRMAYYGIVYDQKMETLCAELDKAYTYFGGVPKWLKVDNMKTAVIKNQQYELTFNQELLEFTQHYTTIIRPCTPYSPEQKGTVESGIKYMQTNFIAGRTFQDEKDIKGQLRDWMDNYANKRIHGTTRKIPKEVFLAEEKGKLQPLPKEEFTFFNRGTRIVAKNCHIHLENNYYSVPAHLIEKEVTVRWNEHIVRIIYQGEQIALHHKTTGQGNHVTVREHMPDYKVYSQTEYQARYEAKMSDIGDHGHQYFKMLLEKNASYWFRGVRSILGLCNKYEKDAVNQSLKRALYHSVTEITTIRHILEKELYLLPLEPKLLEKHVEKPEGEDSLHRDLSYYS